MNCGLPISKVTLSHALGQNVLEEAEAICGVCEPLSPARSTDSLARAGSEAIVKEIIIAGRGKQARIYAI